MPTIRRDRPPEPPRPSRAPLLVIGALLLLAAGIVAYSVATADEPPPYRDAGAAPATETPADRAGRPPLPPTPGATRRRNGAAPRVHVAPSPAAGEAPGLDHDDQAPCVRVAACCAALERTSLPDIAKRCGLIDRLGERLRDPDVCRTWYEALKQDAAAVDTSDPVPAACR